MSIESNKQLIRDFMKSFTAGDMKAVLGLMADDATWWIGGSFPMSGTKTKAQMAELLGGIGASLPQGLSLTPKAFTAEADRVAVETESYGKHVNGKVYSNQYHFLFEVRDGKIKTIREYLDTMHANDVFCS